MGPAFAHNNYGGVLCLSIICLLISNVLRSTDALAVAHHANVNLNNSIQSGPETSATALSGRAARAAVTSQCVNSGARTLFLFVNASSTTYCNVALNDIDWSKFKFNLKAVVYDMII